ncbi:MAG: DUF1592 domain-containing protein [Acidobacteria bacterium]|nr:DUF1592 domain-containing protein [Acidobacteriota bacterium]
MTLALAVQTACVASGAAQGAAQIENAAGFDQDVTPFLKTHCVACHSSELRMGGVDLGAYTDAQRALQDAALWDRATQMVRAELMPPKGLPRPAREEVDRFLRWFESQTGSGVSDADVSEASVSRPGDPGRVTARRLNRQEYNNTVRDLVGIDFRPADGFPADDSGYGFDNIGDVLSLPPVLMEKYLAAAELIAEKAIVAEPHFEPTLEKHLAPRTAEAKGAIEFSWEGSMEVVHDFPRDAEYKIKVSAVDRRKVPEDKPGEPKAEPPPALPFEFTIDGERVEVFQVRSQYYGKNTDEVTLNLPRGPHTLAARFLVDVTKIPDHEAEKYDKPRRMAFGDYFEILGPFNARLPPLPESHEKIFTCGEPEFGRYPPGCIERVIENLARRAYRRPVAREEIDGLKRLIDLARENGDSIEQGMRLVLQAVLVSPHFLFRIEHDPDPNDPGAIHEVDPYELASRLSYFLWSSMPDGRLLERATSLELSRPELLEEEVTRMLADPRSQALIENFAGQWLELRNLALASPDPDIFPEFDDELRSAIRTETELFFETVLREDRTLADFLDGRFTFLNERLARHYGVAGVEGPEFRRVSLDGSQRSGILTQASVLLLSSYPTRTSPVLRGKWLLDSILGTPPPPPPAAVPALEETVVAGGTLRQQLEMHRANPACASCHEKMDALGFGMENYDPIGRWRTDDRGLPLDTSGVLPGGESFVGPAELKQILKAQKADFARCLTEKMLTYALGRGLERFDRSTVDSIVSTLAEDDYRFSRLIAEIVKSKPFRMRRGEEGTS